MGNSQTCVLENFVVLDFQHLHYLSIGHSTFKMLVGATTSLDLTDKRRDTQGHFPPLRFECVYDRLKVFLVCSSAANLPDYATIVLELALLIHFIYNIRFINAMLTVL